jgi:spore germination protein KB
MLLFYVVISVPLLTDSLEVKNLLPVFTLPKGSYAKAVVTAIAEPFANLMIFLELFDENESKEELVAGQYKKSKLGKAVVSGYVLSAGLIIFAVFRDNAVFGEFSKNITAISFQAARLISVGEVLSRLELIFAILFVTTVFFRVSLSLYCLSKLLANTAGRGGSTRFVLPFGMLVWCVSLILFSSNSEMKDWSYLSMPFYVWIFEILIPLGLVLICSVRNMFGGHCNVTENMSKLRFNKDGKVLYYGTLIFSGVLLTVIFFCFFVFNYQIPGPLAPAKWFAEKVLQLFGR